MKRTPRDETLVAIDMIERCDPQSAAVVRRAVAGEPHAQLATMTMLDDVRWRMMLDGTLDDLFADITTEYVALLTATKTTVIPVEQHEELTTAKPIDRLFTLWRSAIIAYGIEHVWTVPPGLLIITPTTEKINEIFTVVPDFPCRVIERLGAIKTNDESFSRDTVSLIRFVGPRDAMSISFRVRTAAPLEHSLAPFVSSHAKLRDAILDEPTEEDRTRMMMTTEFKTIECAVFRKTKDNLGGLSNMAGGYSLIVDGTSIRTSEALYQACRFPSVPKIQRSIIDEKSPMAAKMVSKRYRGATRSDWDDVRFTVMHWVLSVKLIQNPTFADLLESTGDAKIVESSARDAFWGAIPSKDGSTLTGVNALGRLLVELRDAVRRDGLPTIIEPPAIANFLLLGKPIESIKRGG